MLTTTLRFIGLLSAALLMGLTLTHVLQSPGSRSLDGSEWLHVQHTFYGGFAVVGGICEIAGLLSMAVLGTVLCLHRRAREAVVPFVVAAAFFGTLLVFVFGNAPVNAMVASATPATLPSDWSAYRDSWERAHAISALLSTVAFLVLAAALLARRRPRRAAA